MLPIISPLHPFEIEWAASVETAMLMGKGGHANATEPAQPADASGAGEVNAIAGRGRGRGRGGRGNRRRSSLRWTEINLTLCSHFVARKVYTVTVSTRLAHMLPSTP